MPDWLVRNTRNPLDPRKPWSFEHHEYQIQILSDPCPRISTRKSSQVGVSELSARAVLGMCALFDGATFIYTLPTATFSRRFCQTRIDPILKTSPLLSQLLDRDVNSTDLKRIGNSHLYLAGAQKEGISIPARGLIEDEVDFCNQTILSTYESRLTHNEPGTEIVLRLSTPTVPGFGIDKGYKEGTQFHYFCRHDACGEWVEVNPVTDLKVPGFDGDSMLDWSRSLLEEGKIQAGKAYIACPHCKKPVTQENLSDPEKRQWVAKYPDREFSSYQVRPTDVSFYNPPDKIVKASSGYSRHADFVNFALGEPYADVDNSVILSLVERHARTKPVSPELAEGTKRGELGSVVVGMDVGKTCHIVVGRVVSDTRCEIIHMERAQQGMAADRFHQLLKQYKGIKGVVDALPDATLSRACVEQGFHGQVYASYFTRSVPKDLSDFSKDDDDGTVNLPRTNFLDKVVKKLNKGQIVLPREHREKTMFLSHLSKMRKVSRVSEVTGERNESWTSVDDQDHYFFACVYMMAAASMVAVSASTSILLPKSLVTRTPQGGDLVKRNKPGHKNNLYPY